MSSKNIMAKSYLSLLEAMLRPGKMKKGKGVKAGVYAGTNAGKKPMKKKKRHVGMKRSGARNPWLAHVQKVWKAHPGISYKEALMKASKSY